MFNVNEDELLELNRKHYPTISLSFSLAHGSPLELPKEGSHGTKDRWGKHALKSKRRKSAVVDEQWLDIEVFSSSLLLLSRTQAVLLYR
jgi:hypothetical protein